MSERRNGFGLPDVEAPRAFGQAIDFCGEVARRGGRFLDHRRILLGSLIHRGNGDTDLGNSARLRLVVHSDLAEQLVHSTDAN